MSESGTARGSPRVSICMPTYNRSAMLRGAIESALSQDFEDYEIIVSDNASADDTTEVVASFGEPRIRYFRHDTNQGMIPNFNSAMAQSEAEFIVLLPDDDRLLPGALSRSVAVLDEHPRVGFVHSAFRSIDGNDNVLNPAASWAGRLATDTVEPGREFIRKCMPHPSRVCVPTAMFRRAACPDPPYDPEAAILPDLILWLTIALDHDVMFLKEPNAAFRAHDEGDSTGFGTEYPGDVYVYRTDIVLVMRDKKLDWIDRYQKRFDRPDELRALVRGGAARQLLEAAIVEEKRGPMLRQLAIAVRAQPDVVVRPLMWKRTATGLLGRRGTAALKRLIGREDAMPTGAADGGS